jgi:hypothetical protein
MKYDGILKMSGTAKEFCHVPSVDDDLMLDF